MKTVVIASNNSHKVSEIAEILNFADWEFKSLHDAGIVSDPVEDADTFLGNARIKAYAVFEGAHGCAVLADDSGLEVDALGGAPGVYSARYAGEGADDAANNAKLLEMLQDVPDTERTARFVCTLVYIDEEGNECHARGTIEGRIGHIEAGENGFGYDPLFIPKGVSDGRTLAQISSAEKNSMSHRGSALRELYKILKKF